MSTEDLRRLWECFEYVEMRHEECPAWFSFVLPRDNLLTEFSNFPVAATPARGRTANGRGITREACRRSCHGELIELASSCSWSSHALLAGTFNELGAKAIAADEIMGLNSQQYAERDAWNELYGWFDWRPRPPEPDEAIDWIECENLQGGGNKFVPADAIFIGRREAGDESAVAIADSNGCASGTSLDEATLSALLELIERDSIARWWYGGQPSADIELSEACTHRDLRDYLLQRQRKVRLSIIENDFAVWSLVALTFERDGSDVAIGSAASHDLGKAAEGALIEALQMEIPLELSRRTGEQSKSLGLWRKTVSMKTHPLSFRNRKLSRLDGNRSVSLADCVNACAEAGVSAYRVDLSRSEFGLPSVRVLSPQLCHFKPRFNKKRLWESVPRAGDRVHDSPFNQVLLLA